MRDASQELILKNVQPLFLAQLALAKGISHVSGEHGTERRAKRSRGQPGNPCRRRVRRRAARFERALIVELSRGIFSLPN